MTELHSARRRTAARGQAMPLHRACMQSGMIPLSFICGKRAQCPMAADKLLPNSGTGASSVTLHRLYFAVRAFSESIRATSLELSPQRETPTSIKCSSRCIRFHRGGPIMEEFCAFVPLGVLVSEFVNVTLRDWMNNRSWFNAKLLIDISGGDNAKPTKSDCLSAHTEKVLRGLVHHGTTSFTWDTRSARRCVTWLN